MNVATSHRTETGTSELLAELSDGVLTLTMNRPEAGNALTQDLLDTLAAQLERAERDKEVRCVVLTGSGKHFSAGGDLKMMASPKSEDDLAATPEAHIDRQRLSQRATAGRLFHMAKPTLAVLNGAAAGAGLSLALACDMRIMSTDAILTTAFGRVGLPGDYGGSYFMTALIGAACARELYLLSDRVPAERALALGLVNWAFPIELLAGEATAVARRLADGPTVAFRYMKENLNRAIAGNADDCLDMEVTHHVHCLLTADHREAAAAFIEKRAPKFIGA